MLHELPRQQREGKRGAVPIDRGADVDGRQCREQVSVLVIKPGEQRLPSHRTDLVLVLSRPIHLSRRQRGVVDTTHTDDVPQLLAKRREAVANPMWCRRVPRRSGWVRGKVPLILGDCAHKISGQSMEHFAVSYEVGDRHCVILPARCTAGYQCHSRSGHARPASSRWPAGRGDALRHTATRPKARCGRASSTVRGTESDLGRGLLDHGWSARRRLGMQFSAPTQ